MIGLPNTLPRVDSCPPPPTDGENEALGGGGGASRGPGAREVFRAKCGGVGESGHQG